MTTATQCDLIPANESEFELTVMQVSDEQRIRFWPQHFGFVPQWITLEPRIFAWMDRFCDEVVSGPFTRSAMAVRLWLPMLTVTINGICSTA